MRADGKSTEQLYARRVHDRRAPEVHVYGPLPNTGAPPAAASPSQIELARLLSAVWKGKALFLSIVLGCCAIALAVAALRSPQYRSHLTVELWSGINEDLMNVREVDPNASSSKSNSPDAYIQTEMELLRGESLVRRVLQNPQLTREGARKSGLGARIASYLGHRSSATHDPNSAVAAALANLRITQVRESNLLDISFDDTDPRFAAQFLNTLASEAIQRNIDERWNSSQRVGSWLGKQTELLRQKMEQAETKLQEYGKESGLLYTSDKDNVAEARLTQLEQELAQAQSDRILKQSQYELAAKADPDSVPEILESGPLRQYQLKAFRFNRATGPTACHHDAAESGGTEDPGSN